MYIAEGLAPPTSFGVVQDAFRTMYTRASNSSYWTQIWNNGEWKKLAVYAVEAYGIFTIGEMVRAGRTAMAARLMDDKN